MEMQGRTLTAIVSALHRRLNILESQSENMVTRVKLRSKTEVTKIHLGANMGIITVNSHDNTEISRGDDGIIVKMSNPADKASPYVIKVFSTRKGTTPEWQEKYNFISKDQATREIKAMILLKDHPNIFKLRSTELSTCRLQEGTEKPMEESWLIEMEYVDGLVYLTDSPLQYLEYIVESRDKITVNYAHRNRLIYYIYGQVASIIDAFNRHNIRHRDVDRVNLKMQMPWLKLYIMDFARADVPHLDGYDDTEDPDKIFADSQDKRKRKFTTDRNAEMKFIEEMKNRYYDYNQDYKDEIDKDKPSDMDMLLYWMKTVTGSYSRKLAGRSHHDMEEYTIFKQLRMDLDKRIRENPTQMGSFSAPPEKDIQQHMDVYKHDEWVQKQEEWYNNVSTIIYSKNYIDEAKPE